MSRLTPRQRRFCEEFAVDWCAAKAAERAGYSPATAWTQGSRLLTNVDIQARIAELQAECSRRTNIKADDVLRRLIREADAGDLSEPSAARIRAAELMGKHIGMFVDRHELAVKRLNEMSEAELRYALGEDG